MPKSDLASSMQRALFATGFSTLRDSSSPRGLLSSAVAAASASDRDISQRLAHARYSLAPGS